MHQDGETWVLFANWGVNTEGTLAALANLAPTGYGFHASED